MTSRRLLSRGSWPEARYVASALRTETVGGALSLGAAVVALAWANTPWHDAYTSLRDAVVGPAALHLDLTVGTWTAEGLLALFFLVAGIELKREFVAGDLADRSKAALPIAAAACGVAAPAILYAGTARLAGAEAEVFRGWAIPTATDIAFALAVLAVIATHLPSALRSFLLTLAVVDDLIAITIIAVFYTARVSVLFLLLAAVPLAAWWWLLRWGWTNPVLLAVPALLVWAWFTPAASMPRWRECCWGCWCPSRRGTGTRRALPSGWGTRCGPGPRDSRCRSLPSSPRGSRSGRLVWGRLSETPPPSV